MLREKKYIVKRDVNNPILTKDDFPYDITTVFNCGVVKQSENKYTMVCRCEDSGLARYLWVADSSDGVKFIPRPLPLKMPQNDPIFNEYCGRNNDNVMNEYSASTYFDPRVTYLEGQYYIVHAAHGPHKCSLGLFKIDENFETLDWLGLISGPDNRNGVLFPEKINGKYYRLDRPNSDQNNEIWTQSSPDLIHWGVPRCVASSNGWSYTSVGPGAVPIRTEKGWLCVTHGIREQANQRVYGLGVMLLDLNDPSKLLGYSNRQILTCETDYELIGQTPSVVFTNAAILENDGSVKIYYGAADTVQCLAYSNIDDLINACLHE